MAKVSLFQAISNTTKGVLAVVDGVANSATSLSKALEANSKAALAENIRDIELSETDLETIRKKQALLNELDALLY